MKILLLGATGSIGKLFLEQALTLGYRVRVLVRDASRLSKKSSLVEVVEGDALDPAVVGEAVTGVDAVIYSLGPKQMGKPTTLFSDTTRTLIEAMRRAQVKRLIAITGIGAGDSKGHGGWFYDRIIFPFFTKPLYLDKDRQEALIEQSGLEWTIVRPTSFNNGPLGGRLRATDQLEGVTIRSISRADTAAFVLDQLTSKAWLHRKPLVGY